MNTEHLSLARSFAAEYGFIIGLSWGITFILFVLGTINVNSILLLTSYIFIFLQPFIAFYYGWRFKQHLYVGERVSFFSAWYFAALLMGYACIVCACIQFVYFQFFDNGAFFTAMNEIFNNPEMLKLIKQESEASQNSDLMEIYKQSQQIWDTFSEMSAFQKTLNFLSNNIFIGFFLSIPVAIIAHLKCVAK